jgi:hypothetical protein
MPVNNTTSAPVTFVNADGTTGTAPSASVIPQTLPNAAASAGATMVPQGGNASPPNQPRGLSGILSGLNNMFGGQGDTAGGFNPASSAGIAQSTDPFEGLSRNQRMMLGFAALRDAAATLQGQNTSFFNEQLGVFESARDRERLRVQGMQQNRAEILAGLAPVFGEINRLQEAGLEVPQYLRDIVQASLTAGGIDMSGAAAGAAGAAAAPTTTEPATPTATGAEVPALTREEQLRQENAADEELLRRATSEAARADIQARIDSRNAEIAGIEETGTAAATAETLTLPEVDAAMRYLVAGMDEQGNPVFNPMLVTPAGRWAAGVTQSLGYQDFIGAIQTLGTGVLLDALENASVGALSDGERDALTAAQGALDPNNPAGTYRALRRIQQIAQESIARRNAAAGISPQGGGTGELSWE